MADLENLDLIAPADSLYEGGVKINLIRTRVDALYTVLSSITSAEADQIEAIGTTTISAAQWGYLGACGAGGGQLLAALTASESTQLEAIGATTISAAQWGYLGACGTGGGQLLAALTTAESTQLEAIGTTTISAAQWGYLGACVAGGGQLLAALTAAESTQLEAIGTTTISAAQWAYVGALNQGLTTTSTVTFGTINAFTLGGKLTAGAVEIEGSAFDINGGTIDGITSLTAGGHLDIGAYGFTALSLTADGLTPAQVVFAGTGGLLSGDTDFTFATDTLTVTKLGAFQAAGAINFDSQNMTNVDIDSGTIGGVTLDGAIAGGDQAFTGVGDMTFTAGSLLRSGVTGADTLLLAANDTTFITLTTGAPDTCAISGAAIDNCIIGAGTAVALTCTTFTSTGIDDNADANALTISVDEVVSLGAAKLTVGATTPTAAQWGYVGLMNQGVASTDSPQWDHYLRGSIATYQTPGTYVNNVIQSTDAATLIYLVEQGDVDWTDLDMNTAGSSLVPAKANAVILQMQVGDTGFPAGDAYCGIRKKGETGSTQAFYLRPAGNGSKQYSLEVIGLDSDGCIQYKIVASGADTAEFRLILQGWIEPA